MLKRLALLLLLCLLVPQVQAQHLEPTLADPAAEARARVISKDLRCLVCQNQSIEESNAPLARDLRRLVRERIAAGDSDQGVREYLVARYGEWVLLTPRFNERTLLLWLGPLLLLIAGGAVVIGLHRRNRKAIAVQAAPAPLSPEESRRVAELLKTDPQQGER
ncbi:cytochrome c-type biogenesis protein [Ferrovibrio sp.]|uniref:cytochrome c-type biogenesis protein n=1 Tax=Ferrovibrio sp. TaxID=1917215 RepID=UPI001B4AF1D6|nr:cytochrome c-type biogenesis protein [Ferrovibrio sp.]MBP7064180.1 cytochrome c-type biogenesis protein CcmH [Ferrovibrio sp.]